MVCRNKGIRCHGTVLAIIKQSSSLTQLNACQSGMILMHLLRQCWSGKITAILIECLHSPGVARISMAGWYHLQSMISLVVWYLWSWPWLNQGSHLWPISTDYISRITSKEYSYNFQTLDGSAATLSIIHAEHGQAHSKCWNTWSSGNAYPGDMCQTNVVSSHCSLSRALPLTHSCNRSGSDWVPCWV